MTQQVSPQITPPIVETLKITTTNWPQSGGGQPCHRTRNPSGSGGFPFDKTSANVGKQIVDYKTTKISDAILQVLRAK